MIAHCMLQIVRERRLLLGISVCATALLFLLLSPITCHSSPITFLPLPYSSASLAAVDLEDPDTAVDTGREALDSFWDYPWYDAEQDDVRRIRIKLPKPPRPQRTGTSWGRWDFSWFKWVAYAAIVALIGGIAVLLLRAYATRERGRAQTEQDRAAADARRSDADRVESLPFHVAAAKTDLLAEAQRLYEAGDYNGAIIYLYSHLLVQLDRHQAIRLTRGKTNRQYLWEVGPTKPLGRLLESAIVVFEEAFFGNHSISRRQCETCWNNLPEFHRLLERGPEERVGG